MSLRGSRVGTPTKQWATLLRDDCTILHHKNKISLYEWMKDRGLEFRDIYVLCDEGYGNGWEIVRVPPTYKREWK